MLLKSASYYVGMTRLDKEAAFYGPICTKRAGKGFQQQLTLYCTT